MSIERSIRISIPSFVLLVAINTFGLVKVLPLLYPPDTATIRVDMKVSRGNHVELYLNDMARQPSVEQITEGERRVYTFSGIADDITLMRLDPTDAPAAEVDIYSMEVQDSEGMLRRYDGAALGGWVRANIELLPPEAGAFHFVSANNDPIIVTSEKIALRQKAPPLAGKIAREIQSPGFPQRIVVYGFGLFLLIGLFDRRRVLHLPLAAVIIWAATSIMPWVLHSYHGVGPVDTAVGRASFNGLSTRANQLAILTAMLAAIAIALGVRFLHTVAQTHRPWKAYLNARTAPDDSATPGPPTVFRRYLVPILTAIFIGLAGFPDLRGTAHGMMSASFWPHWDSNNFTYWAYLTQTGNLPFRDFWYPYAGIYSFSLPAPYGVLLRWAYQTLLYSVLFFALYKLSGRRFWPPFAAFLLLTIGDGLGMFPNGYRYLLGIVLYLSYLAVSRDTKRITPSLVVFWVICAAGFLIEPPQLVYAGAGIAFKMALDAWQSRPLALKPWLLRMQRDFAVPATFVLLMFGWFALRGQLGGFLQFYARFGDVALYSAIPADFAGHFRMPMELGFLGLMAAPLLIGLGLFEKLRAKGQSCLHADALLGIGAVLLFVLQKHAVRPMEDNFLIYLLAGFFAYAILWQGRRRVVEYVVFGLVMGCFASVLAGSGGLTGFARSVVTAPNRLLDSLRVMAFEGDLIAQANSKYYRVERFDRFPDERAVVARMRALRQNGPEPEAFALTDDPIVYILTGQAPVFHANLHNASPIYEQQRVVHWLIGRKVPYVVFDPASLEWDQFQSLVRSPLVFEAVIEHYVPLERVGRFELLRLRGAGETLPVAYWREKLGPAVYLGHLPRLSSFSRFDPCREGGATGCVNFLEIRLAPSVARAARIAVPIEAGGLQFETTFEAVPGENTYRIFLERLWPWKAGKSSGTPPRVMEEKLPGGIAVQMISRSARGDILY